MKRKGNEKEKAEGKRKLQSDGGKSGPESSDRGGHCRIETLNFAAQLHRNTWSYERDIVFHLLPIVNDILPVRLSDATNSTDLSPFHAHVVKKPEAGQQPAEREAMSTSTPSLRDKQIGEYAREASHFCRHTDCCSVHRAHPQPQSHPPRILRNPP